MFGRSGGGESKSTRTFTETTGSGANAVTKTVVEETIIRADGSKTTNRKETITHGSPFKLKKITYGLYFFRKCTII
jgi:hypothetical protein